MLVLGVNGYFGADHDAGSALLRDGELIAAVEEERLTRSKRAIHAKPELSVKEVLDIGGHAADDIDVIAYPWRPSPFRLDPAEQKRRIIAHLRSCGLKVRNNVHVEFIAHHEAHAWSGIVFTPEERRVQCDVVVVDGSGESTSGGRFIFKHDTLEYKTSFTFESSIGFFYEAATTLAGFSWGEEGKLMGLASYADPEAVPVETAARLASLLAAEDAADELPELTRDFMEVIRGWHSHLLDGRDHPRTFIERARLAALAQRALEMRIHDLVRDCDAPTVVLAGGTALNCTNNGRLATSLAERGQLLIVPPCASDTGIAIGAAASAASRHGAIRSTTSALQGRAFSAGDFARTAGTELSLKDADADDLALRLAEGQIIGWVNGRAEIGPRALGARAILARPSSTRTRDRVNLLKGRETWRPLAPSVTDVEHTRSFVGVPNAYMLMAATVSPEATGLAGVTHVDGTARPHVARPDQHAYGDVIRRLAKATSGPEAVTCTSFNAAGEPMVYSPADAIRSARMMGLDAIAGEGWVAELRSGSGSDRS
ncbi:carbamoyltransferase C-terminal domain-containing protein [Microbacterium sp. LWH10-1.2]|uniref:carbamoyltransferase C-terminal domain-containing protein n=1 Tax=Microbacterium sp. LWH10-1.2 TaxID=3135255 RepID=UPI003139CBF7